MLLPGLCPLRPLPPEAQVRSHWSQAVGLYVADHIGRLPRHATPASAPSAIAGMICGTLVCPDSLDEETIVSLRSPAQASS